MSVFTSDKDKAKLCPIFLDQKDFRDFEAVQKIRSRVFSGLKLVKGESFEKRKMRVSELVRAIHGMIQNADKTSNLSV